MILRTATQTRLNDVLVCLLATADFYQGLAKTAASPELGELVADLESRRRRAAERTEQFVRREQTLPDVPDRDWESLEQLWTEVHGNFGAKGQVQVTRALEHEGQLARAVGAALEHSVAGDVRTFLSDLELEVRNARKRLEELVNPPG